MVWHLAKEDHINLVSETLVLVTTLCQTVVKHAKL